MSYLDTATSYLTDKQIRFLKKFVFVIFVVVGLILVDNIFSFSYYTNVSNKTTQIKEINQILESNSLSKKETIQLKSLRTQVINHKYLFERDFVSQFKITFTDGRNGLIHYLTSSWYLLFLMISLPFLGKYHPLFSLETIIIVLVVFEPILLFTTWFNAKVLAQLPLIGGWIILNYIFNIFLGIILTVIIVKVRKALIQSISKINAGRNNE